jgi:hypothetical protein
MNKNKKKLIAAKTLCNEAKIGTEIVCPSCGSKHIKKSYQSVFCKTKGKTKCKDNFWNNVDPSKRCNTTRISPANAAYYHGTILPEKARELGFPDVKSMKSHVDENHGGWDEHNCHVEPCKWCELRPEFCKCD